MGVREDKVPHEAVLAGNADAPAAAHSLPEVPRWGEPPADVSACAPHFGVTADGKHACALIACAMLEDEVRAAHERYGRGMRIVWFDRAYHERPDTLRAKLQELVDAVEREGATLILLAMGLCGNGAVGLSARHATLAMPRFDDCINLMLEDGPRTCRGKAQAGTMYLTRGWSRDSVLVTGQRKALEQKYGCKRAQRLMEAMYGSYRAVSIIDNGCYNCAEVEAYARECAEELGVETRIDAGSNQVLEKLISGAWDGDIVVSGPGRVIVQEDFSDWKGKPMLTPSERLNVVLDGGKADRPPCICPGGMMNMVTVGLQDEVSVFFPEAHSDAAKMAALAKAVYDKGFFENYGVPFCMTVEAEAMGAEVTLGRKDIEPHVTGYAIDDVRDYRKVAPMDLSSGRAKAVLDALAILRASGDGVPIVGNVVGPVSVASSVMEATAFYKQLRKEPELSHEYMRFITDELIRFGVAQVKAGADIIAIADPSGTGEIMGPRPFNEFAVPYIEKLQKACQDAGARTIVHICGQMHAVYDQIAKISANALSFDAIVPIKEARKNLPGKVIMGNVSTFAIELKDSDKVRSLTKACMRNGSDIVSPACGLGMSSPSENVRAVLEAVKGE